MTIDLKLSYCYGSDFTKIILVMVPAAGERFLMSISYLSHLALLPLYPLSFQFHLFPTLSLIMAINNGSPAQMEIAKRLTIIIQQALPYLPSEVSVVIDKLLLCLWQTVTLSVTNRYLVSDKLLLCQWQIVTWSVTNCYFVSDKLLLCQWQTVTLSVKNCNFVIDKVCPCAGEMHLSSHPDLYMYNLPAAAWDVYAVSESDYANTSVPVCGLVPQIGWLGIFNEGCGRETSGLNYFQL